MEGLSRNLTTLKPCEREGKSFVSSVKHGAQKEFAFALNKLEIDKISRTAIKCQYLPVLCWRNLDFCS